VPLAVTFAAPPDAVVPPPATERLAALIGLLLVSAYEFEVKERIKNGRIKKARKEIKPDIVPPATLVIRFIVIFPLHIFCYHEDTKSQSKTDDSFIKNFAPWCLGGKIDFLYHNPISGGLRDAA
jgi:hypothetical protein